MSIHCLLPAISGPQISLTFFTIWETREGPFIINKYKKMLTVALITTKESRAENLDFLKRNFQKKIMEYDTWKRWKDSSSFALSHKKWRVCLIIFCFPLLFDILLACYILFSQFPQWNKKIEEPSIFGRNKLPPGEIKVLVTYCLWIWYFFLSLTSCPSTPTTFPYIC